MIFSKGWTYESRASVSLASPRMQARRLQTFLRGGFQRLECGYTERVFL